MQRPLTSSNRKQIFDILGIAIIRRGVRFRGEKPGEELGLKPKAWEIHVQSHGETSFSALHKCGTAAPATKMKLQERARAPGRNGLGT